jgi:hypothetical protein
LQGFLWLIKNAGPGTGRLFAACPFANFNSLDCAEDEIENVLARWERKTEIA